MRHKPKVTYSQLKPQLNEKTLGRTQSASLTLKASELSSLPHASLVQKDNLKFSVFVHQMRCAVWTVNLFALADLAVALAARLHLRAAITISRQHFSVTSTLLFKAT
jgi:hypothetical protein